MDPVGGVAVCNSRIELNLSNHHLTAPEIRVAEQGQSHRAHDPRQSGKRALLRVAKLLRRYVVFRIQRRSEPLLGVSELLHHEMRVAALAVADLVTAADDEDTEPPLPTHREARALQGQRPVEQSDVPGSLRRSG